MLTLANIYDLLKEETSDLWSGIVIDSRIDKEVLTDHLLEECGNLVSIYSSASAFKHYSDMFFKRNSKLFKEMIDTTLFDYNPIENYNMVEGSTRTASGTGSSSGETSGSGSHYSFDSSTAQPVDASSSENSQSSSSASQETSQLTRSGNIGVTTTQQMIQSQREVILFNVYDEITKRYADALFVGIY